MGTWGHDAYSNDDAADWLCELEETNGLKMAGQPISRTLFVAGLARVLPFAKNTSAFRIMSYFLAQGSVTQAAAETIAALGGRADSAFPQSTISWVNNNRTRYNKTMANRALKAMLFIRDHSELRRLHDEGESPDIWLSGVNDLISRLSELKNA